MTSQELAAIAADESIDREGRLAAFRRWAALAHQRDLIQERLSAEKRRKTIADARQLCLLLGDATE